MLAREFLTLAKIVNSDKVNKAIKAGYVDLASWYLADIFEQKADEAYAHRTIRPWHVDQPNPEIEANLREIASRLRSAC